MDETAQDAQFISGIIKKDLGDKINEVLSSSTNEAKISNTLMQSINVSLRNSINGPILLYSLLDNSSSLEAVNILVTKIFTQIYSAKKKQKDFITQLLTQLNDPPYASWFKPPTNTVVGGRKGKTMRKHKGKKNRRRPKTCRRKMYGGEDTVPKQYSNLGFRDGLTGIFRGKAHAKENRARINKVKEDKENAQNEISAQRTADGNKGISKGLATMSAAWSGKKPETDTSVTKEGSGQTEEDGEQKKGRLSSMKDKMSSMMGYGENADTGEGADIGEGVGEGVGEGTGAGAGAGSSDVTADDFKEYNNELMNKLKKRLDESTEDLLERVLNAAYKYTKDNGETIVESIIKSLSNNSIIQNIIPNARDIIIIQALYASNDVQRAIEQTYSNIRKEQSNNDQIEFNPTTKSFILDFLRNLKNMLVIN